MKINSLTYLLIFISILGITATHASQKEDLCELSFREPLPVLTLPSENSINKPQSSKSRRPRKERHIIVSPKNEYDPYKDRDKRSFDKDTRILIEKKEKRKIEQQVERMNNELRRKDSRPPFISKKAYEKWLSNQQRSNTTPYVYYGYVYRIKKQKDGSLSFEIEIRPIPHWIKYPDFLKLDAETWQKYTSWAESYFKKFKMYPPFYLEQVQEFIKQTIRIKPGQKEAFFVQNRGLENVLYTLGQSDSPQSSKLLDMINNLKGDDFWIDGGTGKGFVIQDSIQLLSETRHSKDLPYITGITFDSHNDSAVFQNSHKHKIWSGQFFEDIPVSNFSGQKAKLITDFHGIFLYSSQPEQVINKYLKLLTKDGAIAIVYRRENYTVIKDKGKELTFADWLSSQAPSLQIETGLGIRQDQSQDTPVLYMIIRNPSGTEIILPPLTLSLSLHNNVSHDHDNYSPRGASYNLRQSDHSQWNITRILRPQNPN